MPLDPECPMCGGEGVIDQDLDPEGEGRKCPRCYGNHATVHLEEPMICQLCLAGGSGMGCICEDCEDRYNSAIARVAELEEAIRTLDATDTAHRHTGLGDPAKAYSDLISLVQ